MKTEIFDYDLQKFNFTEIIANALNVENLSEIKAEETQSDDGNSIYKNMEQTSAYQKLYSFLNSSEGEVFYKTYKNFIKEVIQPQYSEPIYYQEKPTHRILYSNAQGVSRFHRDSDYGHHPAEINYFLPQTSAFDTNSIWIETEVGKEDFSPMNVNVGQFAKFKGVSLMHGAKNNATGKTRVSFDFRIIPSSQFPKEVKDTSKWKEEDKENPLFKNAHNFVLCK